MFKVTLEGVDYKVAFHHNSKPDFMEKRKYTVCNIYIVKYPIEDAADQKPTYELISTGYAYCSLKDNFNYELGRKISLGRALHNRFLKKERDLFVNTYHNKQKYDTQRSKLAEYRKLV